MKIKAIIKNWIEKNIEYKQIFESGIEMNKFRRIIFSIQFFIIAFIFILFDLEIIILLTLLFYLNNYLFFIYLIFFIFFILISLIYEWKYNKLIWFK